MTDDRNTPPPSKAVARHLVRLGEDAIKQMMATVERAQELLASGTVPPFPEGTEPPAPCAWETTEPQLETPKRVWFAYVDDFATGEGLSVYFAAALARDEDEFRRSISLELGREPVNKAEVRVGVRGSSMASRFIPAHLREHSGSVRQGLGPPATMSFLVRYRANYS